MVRTNEQDSGISWEIQCWKQRASFRWATIHDPSFVVFKISGFGSLKLILLGERTPRTNFEEIHRDEALIQLRSCFVSSVTFIVLHQ